MATKVEAAEKERIEEQKKLLGEEGLKKKGEELKAAKAMNDREIPKEILESFGIPDVSCFVMVSFFTSRDIIC